MRPIKLKMSAFGAYVKTSVIDFEEGLRGENFFLIHGATGSGKTTILDAICFALYGKTSGGSRTGEMMRSEQATPNYKTEVEFTFALRGKIYRIVRNPKYMRYSLRGDNLTEQKASAEIFEDGVKIPTRDVSEYVRDLLGFDSEQFRQVIVLPQGAFQKFLLAKSADKQEVLNMLFDAEFFKRVEDELKAKASEARRAFETLTERKKNWLEEIGAEEELPALIKKLTEELDAAENRLKILAAEVETAQKKFSEGESLAKLFRELKIRADELIAAQKELEKISGEMSASKVEFDKRTAEESRREELKLKAAELDKKKKSAQELQIKQQELDAALKLAEESAKNVAKFTNKKGLCDKTMAKLKAEVELLRDAPAKLKVAEQKLKEVQARAKLLQEVDKLRKNISEAEKNLSATKNAHAEAEKFLETLREAQKVGSAAILAANLIEGEPCPVCGAIHHPKPAISTKKIPTDAQIKSAEREEKFQRDKKSNIEEKLAKLKGELETKEKTLSESAEVMTVADAQAEVDKLSIAAKTLENDRARIKNGETVIAQNDKDLLAAQEADKKNSGAVEKLRGIIENMKSTIDAKYLSDQKLLDAEISSATRELNRLNYAFNQAQENFNKLNRSLAAQKAKVEAAEKNKADTAAQVEGKILPNLDALKKNFDETRENWQKAVGVKAKISARLERANEISKKISALNDELAVAEKNSLMWTTLSNVASGKTSSRISFQRYYLATMFAEVILEANNRLEKMSGGRYRFQNKIGVTDGRIRSAGLDLEIVDEYTGTARAVETLSGGESFLASLSLALGLAAVVQNNSGGVKLDTIFIDEGFGTLDAETLDFAMKTLIELQGGGRLVGIISHVEELKNQMPVRLEVYKTKTGSEAKFRYGLSRD